MIRNSFYEILQNLRFADKIKGDKIDKAFKMRSDSIIQWIDNPSVLLLSSAFEEINYQIFGFLS